MQMIVLSSGQTMTRADALRIQAEQVDHYAKQHGEFVRELVASATTADALEDKAHPVRVINEHIPRGGAIEDLIARAKRAAQPAPDPNAAQFVRVFSPVGPCLTEGKLIRKTPRFYVYEARKGQGGRTPDILH